MLGACCRPMNRETKKYHTIDQSRLLRVADTESILYHQGYARKDIPMFKIFSFPRRALAGTTFISTENRPKHNLVDADQYCEAYHHQILLCGTRKLR